MSKQTIGIMGAMPEEISGIVDLMTETTETITGMRTYYSGRINNTDTVVVFSRWGKVAAAATVSTLIHKFHITKLIFMGVAGAVSDELSVGDIVLASRLIQHDVDARPLMPQHEIPLLGKTYFETDNVYSQLAASAINTMLEEKMLHEFFTDAILSQFDISVPRLFIGDIASGDQFFSSNEQKKLFHNALPEVLCIEMEGAAVAQVCYEYNIPFVVIRTISDTADDQAHIDFPLFIKTISSKYAAFVISHIFRYAHQ
jgi:adenosylhomocysteine nucleosidase